MNPKIWGPTYWYIFHIISYSYDEKYKNNYINMFKYISFSIPCITCKNHFKNLLIRYPPHLNINDRDIMIKWLVDLHNFVNKRLGKKVITLSNAKNIYYKNEKLIINHQKIIKFIEIIKKSISGNSIAINNVSNILINFCSIIPCDKCREKLLILVNQPNLIRTQGLIKFSNSIINIIKGCK